MVTDVAVDERGFFYVLDATAHCVHVFDNTGHKRGQFGRLGQGPGELKSPGGLLLSVRGEVLVGDVGNRRICIWDTSGNYVRTVGCTRGVGRIRWLDEAKGLIVTRSSGGGGGEPLMVVYDLSGAVVQAFAVWPPEVLELQRKMRAPISGSAFEVAPDGEVLVCHAAVYRVMRYTADGVPCGLISKPQGSGFIAPPSLPPTISSQSVREWGSSWTAIGKLVALAEAVVVQMWGHGSRNDAGARSYLVDVMTRDGKPFRCALPTAERIVSRLDERRILTLQEIYSEGPSSPQLFLRIRRWERKR
ncbi:MAG: hypothetical protein QHJ34_14075 [bacterium]|jgi:hypothetical protein|nr:hypothetical protein [candidate division KSB1 bacterium]MDH7561337.1 hypothetical protein [bacterium]